MGMEDRRQSDRREPPDPDIRLLAYQLEQADRRTTTWQEDLSRAILRLEGKVDNNMEKAWDNYGALDTRITMLERQEEARERVQTTLERKEDQGFTSLQKVAIYTSIVLGAGGLVIAFLAIVATVLVNVLQ